MICNSFVSSSTIPNQKSVRMEDMSDAFLRALCAANGYSISITYHDNDGLDISAEHTDKVLTTALFFHQQ